MSRLSQRNWHNLTGTGLKNVLYQKQESMLPRLCQAVFFHPLGKIVQDIKSKKQLMKTMWFWFGASALFILVVLKNEDRWLKLRSFGLHLNAEQIAYSQDAQLQNSLYAQHVSDVTSRYPLWFWQQALAPLVKSVTVPPCVFLTQIFGRNLILFVVLGSLEEMQSKPVVFFVFYFWSIIELFRFVGFLFQQFVQNNGIVPKSS